MKDKLEKFKSINPVIGCSIGCPYCYARRMNQRFSHTPDFTKPQLFPERLMQFYKKKPMYWFFTTMSDLSEWDPFWIEATLSVIRRNPQHRYMFLTKRPDKLHLNLRGLNICAGVTITCKADLHRMDELVQNIKSDAYTVTFEPLFEDLGKIKFPKKIDYIVIGTETGNRKGKITAKKEWIMNIAEQAHAAGINVIMKAALLPIVGEENWIQDDV